MASDDSNAPEAGQESFKQQLDRKAVESRHNAGEQPSNGIVEKITDYISASSKVLGLSSPVGQQSGENQQSDARGPPDRPDHDHKIEEFVRDQYRSKTRSPGKDA